MLGVAFNDWVQLFILVLTIISVYYVLLRDRKERIADREQKHKEIIEIVLQQQEKQFKKDKEYEDKLHEVLDVIKNCRYGREKETDKVFNIHDRKMLLMKQRIENDQKTFLAAIEALKHDMSERFRLVEKSIQELREDVKKISDKK